VAVSTGIIRTGLSVRRQLTGFAIAALSLSALTALFASHRDTVHQATALSCYLLAVVVVAGVGGIRPAVLAAVAAPVLANWFLIEPLHTLTIRDREDVISLIAFVAVAIIVSFFVSVAARRAADADAARGEAETLARLAAGARSVDPLQTLADHLRESFGLAGVSVQRSVNGVTEVVAASGQRIDAQAPGDQREDLGDGVCLLLRGEPLTADAARVLRAFALHARSALEQARLTEAAEQAEALQRTEALRTSLLQAVSHDLRTPLAGIKASVSSLRQGDVQWPAEVQAEFLASIEEQTDRLTRIVTNLLDLSRLQAGAMTPERRPFSLEEVVPAAVHSLGADAHRVRIDLRDDLPDVVGDPALTERAVANLVGNAVKWSPKGRQVVVSAAASSSVLELSVVDEGPGIRSVDRAAVVQPFQRLGDRSAASGLGLGLAIVDGLTKAMGGALELRDTRGGGLTAVIRLPVAAAA
jgi:two-component system, OmpR family, sensor histidine kinase KdpD